MIASKRDCNTTQTVHVFRLGKHVEFVIEIGNMDVDRTCSEESGRVRQRFEVETGASTQIDH